MGLRDREHSLSSGRLARLLLCLFVSTMIVASFAASRVSGEALGSAWGASTSYSNPGVDLESCTPISDFNEVYCVGGYTGLSYSDVVQYASYLPAGGVGGWTATTVYPLSISGESCPALGETIFCVGGSLSNTLFNDVYTAQSSSSGLGTWTAAPPYPLKVQLESCVGSGVDIYCVGGLTYPVQINVTTSTPYTNQTNFAEFSSSSGLGSWSESTSYPIPIEEESCVTYSSYIYCIAGYDGITGWFGQDYPVTDQVYYAPLSTGGIGDWTNTTAYPFPVYGQSCAVQYDYVYCVGGYTKSGPTSDVYYAPLSTSGVGNWTQTTSYPAEVVQESCTTYYGDIDCIGGLSGNTVLTQTYADTISPLAPITVTVTTFRAVTFTDTVLQTTTKNLDSTVSVTKTLTSTSTVHSVSSVTSTKTVTSTSTSTAMVTSVTATSTSQAVAESQPQTQPAKPDLFSQIVPLVIGSGIGAAGGVGAAIGTMRFGKRKKKQPSADDE